MASATAFESGGSCRRAELLLLFLLASPALAHSIVDVAMRIEAPSFVAAQQTFSYRVIADDLANDAGFGIVVADTLPPNVTFVDASGSGWNCSRSGSTVSCSAEQINPGPNAITIRVTAPRAPATLTNKVKVTSVGSFDPTAANDRAEHAAVVYDPSQCAAAAPQLIGPVEGAFVSGAAALAWTPVAGATRYAVFAAVEGEKAHAVATTTSSNAAITLGRGKVEWWIEAQSNVCPSVTSAKGHFEVTDSGVVFAAVPFAASGFRAPAGIAIAPTGEIYATDRDDAVVRQIDASGHVTTIAGAEGSAGAAEGQFARFNRPMGVAVTPLDGYVFVADQGNDAVRILYPGGSFVPAFTVGGMLGVPGLVDNTGDQSRMNAPTAVAATERGTLYAADTGNNAIRKLSPVPGYVGLFALSTVATELAGPTGVAVDDQGAVYVSDTGNRAIRKIAGTTVSTFAQLSGQPGALAIDAYGNLYVCDISNGAILRISPSGLLTTLITGLRQPGGVAVAADGTVYVAETGGGRVVRLEATPARLVRRRAIH